MIRCTNSIFSACPSGYLEKPARKKLRDESSIKIIKKNKMSGCKESCDRDNDCMSFEYNSEAKQCKLHSKTKFQFENQYVFVKDPWQLCAKGNIFSRQCCI